MTYTIGDLKRATGDDIAEPTPDDSDLANASDPDSTVMTGVFMRGQALSLYGFDSTKGKAIHVYITAAKVQDWIDNGGGRSTILADLSAMIEYIHKQDNPGA